MLEQFFFHLGPEAANGAQCSRLDRCFKLRQIRNPQFAANLHRVLRPESGQMHQGEHSSRDLGAKLAMKREFAGFHQRLDFCRQVLADPCGLGHLVEAQIREICWIVKDGAGSVSIGANAEEIRSRKLEHVGGFAQHAADLAVLHEASRRC